MKKLIVLICVALLSSNAYAAYNKYRSYAPKAPIKQKNITEDEKKIAEEEKYDVGKMAERLKQQSKK